MLDLYRGCEGPESARIVLVGEAWGEDEEEAQRPFQGKAGRCLDRHLAVVPLDRSTLRITNLVKARPPGNDIAPWFAKVPKKEFERLSALGCLTYSCPKGWEKQGFDYYALTERGMEARALLLEELRSYKEARVIVPLGGSSSFALTGIAPILRIRGAPFKAVGLPLILPTLHPSYIMRGQYLQGVVNLVGDLRKAVRMTADGFELPKRTLLHSPTLSEALYHLGRLQKSALVASDIELVGNEVACISLSDSPDWAMSIPLLGYYGDAQNQVLEALGELYANPEVAKLFQNCMFDCYILREQLGFEFKGPLHDTMILQQIGYPELSAIKGNALDSLAARYTYEPFWKDDGKQSRSVGDFTQLRTYNCTDSAVLPEIWREQAHIREDRNYGQMYQDTMRLAPVCLDMMQRGFLTDPLAWQKALDNITAGIKPLQEELNALAGWGVNPSSDEDCKRLFYEQLKVKPFTKVRKRKGGEQESTVTVDEEALERMAAGTAGRPPIREAALVLDIRQFIKTRGFFQTQKKGKPPKDKRDADGRYRTSIRLRGTVSGRFSMSETYNGTGGPHNTLPESFKSVVIPTPGHFFWAIDKEKAEWAEVALECGDANMLRCLEEGRDPYAWTAHLATGLPYEVILAEAKAKPTPVTREEFSVLRERWSEFKTARNISDVWLVRQMYKEACLAFNYQMSAETFSLRNRIPLPQAKMIRRAYLSTYPGLARGWSDVEYRLRTTKTIVSPVGHKIKFIAPVNGDLLRKAVNYSPQNTVNFITKEGLLFAHEHPRLIPLLERHDEVMGEYPLSDLGSAMEDLRALSKAMSRPLEKSGRTLVIGNELKVSGTTWAALKPISLDASTDDLRKALASA